MRGRRACRLPDWGTDESASDRSHKSDAVLALQKNQNLSLLPSLLCLCVAMVGAGWIQATMLGNRACRFSQQLE